MKILEISNYYYPHIGGIEQTSRDIANALKDKHEIKVFCFNHEKKNSSDIVDGVEIIRTKCFAKVASQSLSFSYGKILKKVFDEFRPDAVIFHYPNPFAAHFLKKQLKKHPSCHLILWWHLDITKQKLLKNFFTEQSKWLLSHACKVVATSPNYIAGSDMLQSVRNKCIVIPSCINNSRVSLTSEVVTRAEQLKREENGKIICFAVGRHVEYKGLKYLVEASKLLGPEYVIWIGGEGPLTGELKALAGGDKKVCFLGRLSDEELKSRLYACDIFCFPSITKNEAFGLALAEAMACGKPAVTFTIPGSGVNYVSLNGQTGIEVDNRDVKQYAQAIKTLGEDENLRKKYGDNAKTRAEEVFSGVQFNKSVTQLFSDLREHS